MGGEKGIEDLREYVKSKVGLMGEIFGNRFKGIFNLMKALGAN
ncbi:hypothetical protein [Staphylococcus saprophyticus]|nr:hypothetical protein [Staphylococcus saprophyticus]